jgi:hypothetical protein
MAALKAAGVTAVGRYIGWDSVPGFSSIGKNLTTAEAAQLHGAGVAVFLAFEYAPDATVLGATQGIKDGQLAAKQLAALSAPSGMGVYFAVDFDIPDYATALDDTAVNARAKLGPVAQYFAAIRGLKPAYQVGAYGGYYAVKRLFDAGLITLGWQTIAWSGGQRDHRAQLYQTGGTTLAGGADVNVHETTAPDFGQWPRPAIPAPAPAPAPKTPVPPITGTQGGWRWCEKCECLVHGPGACARGGNHNLGIWNYSLPFSHPAG